MAGALLERELNSESRARFEVATQADDPEIRRLLRNNPMRGAVSISLEREPDYFTEIPSETRTTIIARAGSRLVCVGSCAFRSRYVNGVPRRVGYLGALRLDAPYAGRFDILRRGYKFFHDLQKDEPANFYFTAIASDNVPARRFLEREVPGMPRYQFIGEFVTLLIRARIAKACIDLGSGNPENEPRSSFQFAPCDDLPGRPIWDQRHFKQTVIRGYSSWLTTLRPLLNLFGARLPAVGETLSNAFVTDIPTSQAALPAWLSLRLHEAHERRINFLTAGFAANDPRLETVRRHFKAREYNSRLYIVRWADCGGAASDLDQRILAPDISLL
jgi:hypothetical protein